MTDRITVACVATFALFVDFHVAGFGNLDALYHAKIIFWLKCARGHCSTLNEQSAASPHPRYMAPLITLLTRNIAVNDSRTDIVTLEN